MKRWLRRLRGTMGMGLAWAGTWAFTGVLIGVASLLFPGPGWDAFFRIFDAPLPALAVPGFVGGALFSVVLGVAGRRRRFHSLSLPVFAAWGALGGLLLSLVPATMVTLGFATVSGGASLGIWQFTAVITGPVVLLSSVSAVVSLLIARRAEGGSWQEGTADNSEAALGKQVIHPFLGGGTSLGSHRESRMTEPARRDGSST